MNLDVKVHHWILMLIRGKSKEDYAHMLKNDNHYYVVSHDSSDNKYIFELKINSSQHLWNKPTEVCSTTYDSTYVTIQYGGFDM